MNSKRLSLLKDKGQVIPAHPLALNKNRKLNERYQRALTRYYLDSGVTGLAVGVHTTQFEIRDPKIGLYQPVLELAKEEMDQYERAAVLSVAGVVGKTKEAVAEAKLARDLGYDMALLGMAAFPTESNEIVLDHCRAVSEVIPIIGFYFQPAVGGRYFDVNFWRAFAEIENVVAIKIAPFSRYHTFDVVRAVVESGRSEEITLLTGNDDNIVVDLLSEFEIQQNDQMVRKRISGGLLGHWSVWTKRAVELVQSIHDKKDTKKVNDWLIKAHQVTDTNAAFFDAAHNFSGCIVGLHEVLRRQGLMEGTWTLNEHELLSPSQKEEIDRVYRAYPALNDDDFVTQHLDKWLS